MERIVKISVQNVSVELSGRFSLRDLQLEFGSAQTYVILGESGSGKSTLLKALVGLVPISLGRVNINGIEVSSERLKDLATQVGYMPQHYGLFPHMTVERNISIQAEILGWNRERIRSRIEEMMNVVGMSRNLLKVFPSQLSGGQKQRVALMRCMFLDQPIFLFDEPLSALDVKTKKDILQEWSILFSQLKKLVVVVTHSPFEARALGGEILVMKEGHVVERGTYEDLSRRQESLLSREFLQ